MQHGTTDEVTSEEEEEEDMGEVQLFFPFFPLPFKLPLKTI